ncbi:MAG: PorP/SprF family type IX secretion system membrane protein [Prevotellaceae bacterium]|jgi:type IX secretion system PorP/SprF family membrane protein|nr:PorP/SprF family type IX secretion system membrane protein [Prevotellaceae bacterium]
MANLKKGLWGVAMLLCFTAKAQQDPQFSLGFLNRVFTNPGEVGNTTERLFCATMANRLELMAFEGSPVVNVLSLHGPVTLFGISSGIGITLHNDVAGSLRAPGFNAAYAYRRPLFQGTLGIGIEMGMLSSWYAGNSWRLPDGGASDQAVPAREEAALSFDMNAGVAYHSSTWFGGIACKHLTAPTLGKERIAQYRQTCYLYAGYRYPFAGSQWSITPMFSMVTDFAQTSWRIDAAARYGTKYLLGVGHRWRQAITGMVGMNILNGVEVVYAYDFFTSAVNRFSGGCHELTVSYSFSLTVPKGTQRYKSIRYL